MRQSSLAQNASWLLLGQALSVFCLGAYFILLARLLGRTEYGIYVGAVAMVSTLSQFTTLGLPWVLLRHVSPDSTRFPLYWGNVLATTITLGCVCVAFLALAGPHFAHSYSWQMLLFIALGDCLCAQLTSAASLAFQAFEKMHVTAALSLLVNLLRAIVAGAMLYFLRHGTALQWVVAAFLVSVIAVATALVLVTRFCGGPAFSLQLLLARLREGCVFALSYSTTGVYNNVDKAMLGHYGMNDANGIYTMAYRVIDVFTMPIVSVQAAAFPRFFRKGVEGVRRTAEYSIRIIKRTAALGLLSALAILLSAPIIPHVLGNDFSGSVAALRWLCVMPVFRSFQLSAGDALTGAGHQDLRLKLQATAAAFNFGINLYLIPHYSWQGAAWSSLVTDGMLAIFNWTGLWWLTSSSVLHNRFVGEDVRS